jgi:hypothetical protein
MTCGDCDDLVAREAIRDLVARYNHYGDRGRWDQLGQLFADDAVLELVDIDGARTEYQGRPAIVNLLQDIGSRWAEESRARGKSAYVRHSVSTHVIDFAEPHRATGYSYVTVVRAFGIAEWGRYLDRYRFEPGGWRLERRSARTDGRLPSPPGSVP